MKDRPCRASARRRGALPRVEEGSARVDAQRITRMAAPVSVARRWVEDDEIRDLGTEDVPPPPARLGQN
ncbi:hypothetical protein BE18_39675 [Sorangium cellulosum]|uniref:Uncharacterized protein n=1 Tax=Sorangium cellulosum TaxID=56 RepID=A0A150R6X8_SORCE|nr:hypothetical protein BE18_39675 [Sorangium cellulosum]